MRPFFTPALALIHDNAVYKSGKCFVVHTFKRKELPQLGDDAADFQNETLL